MAYDREYNYTSIGNYQPRGLKYTPIGDKVRESILASIDQYNKTATFNKTMQEGFSKIPLAAEESEWAQGLLNDAKNRIKANPRDLTGAMQIGDELLNNPELLGKSKYYQQREETRERLNSRNDIDSNIRDWYWDKHKYAPKKILDGNNNVVGIEEFDKSDQPLARIEWTDVMHDILRGANPSGSNRSWSSSSYVDGSGGGSGGHNNVLSLSRKDLSAGVKEWINTNSAKVNQQWEVDLYVYNRNKEKLKSLDPTSDEYKTLQQQVNRDKEIFENEKTPYTLQNYVVSRCSEANPYVVLGAYTRTDTDSQRNSTRVTKEPKGVSENPNGYEVREQFNEDGSKSTKYIPIKGQNTGTKNNNN